jgi:hypothetical protein
MPRDISAWIETLLAFYALGLLILTLTTGIWNIVFWLLIYTCGFSYVASLNFIQPNRTI